jgi:hypothetical protein
LSSKTGTFLAGLFFAHILVKFCGIFSARFRHIDFANQRPKSAQKSALYAICWSAGGSPAYKYKAGGMPTFQNYVVLCKCTADEPPAFQCFA